MHAECAHPVGLHACTQTCKDTSTVGLVKCSHANAESHLNELLAVRCDKWPAVSAGANAARAHWMRWDQSRTHPEMLQGGMRLGTDEATIGQWAKNCFWVSVGTPALCRPFRLQDPIEYRAHSRHRAWLLHNRPQRPVLLCWNKYPYVFLSLIKHNFIEEYVISPYESGPSATSCKTKLRGLKMINRIEKKRC